MYLENRLIAMIDVLGFSERIRDPEGLKSTSAQYSELIAEARNHIFQPAPIEGGPDDPKPNFEYGQFVFDTIVLVSRPVDVHSTRDFIFATILLMERFFENGYPLRGAISIGDFYKDNVSDVFLSNVFKPIRLEEENQQWSGCVLLPDVEKSVVNDLLGPATPDQQRRAWPLHYLQIPTKDGNKLYRWCLNWAYFLPATTLKAGLAFMEGAPQKHYGTDCYLSSLNQLPDDEHPLDDQYAPATRMKMMKARAGLRFKLEDNHGNAIPVPPGFWISIH